MNNENLTTTKPKAIMPMLVRIQAKSVRSFAKWSLAFWFLIISLTTDWFSSLIAAFYLLFGRYNK